MVMAGPSGTVTDVTVQDQAGSHAPAPEAARLLAVQLLSPAFPTGAFAYASGLEWAIAGGVVTDVQALALWLADVVEYGSGWSDAVVLALSLRNDADHEALSDLARALCLTSERLTETMEQGAAFARTAGPLTGTASEPTPLPVAIGRACTPLGLPPGEIIALMLHGMALNLTLAAVRFVPLGQSDGQQVIAGLAPLILRVAKRAAVSDEGDLGGCAYGADLAAMRHETMETRIFRT